ncbi:MAG: nitroreductase family protein [Chloroflexi bacterium]|nr:nitroreductase family protein [Chloroflexota bacterium]
MGEPTVTESDIFEVIGTQRAMRRLKPDPVPEEHIKKMIWAATRAPNGGNVQPWRFLVITDAEKKKRLHEIYLAEWNKYKAEREAAPPPPNTSAEDAKKANATTSSGQYLADHLSEVPVIIIPCGFLLAVNTGIASGSSIYPAIQNLMLAARALGLGTALTTLHRHNEGAVRELLGIPENAHTAAMIPVGWPMGRFGAGPRLPVEAVTYWDQWGTKRA